MKGIQVNQFGGPDVLEYVDLPDPVPQSGQVLIEVKGASVNFADIKARAGQYHLGKKPPFVPGIDVAGVVIQTDPDVKNIKTGDRVIAFPSSGSYAEKALAAEHLTFVIPDSLDFQTAAACPIVMGTALHGLVHVARIEAGESLLVHAAAGGVGSTAVKLAKALGVPLVIGTVGSPWKEEHVRKMGADLVVDYNDDYAEEIGELTKYKGVDVVLNPIGGPTVPKDLNCLAPFGRIVVLGNIDGQASQVPLESLHEANKSVMGLSFGHYRRFRPEAVRGTMEKVIELLADKKVEIQVGKRFPLKDAPRAHREIEERTVLGKAVLVPGE